MSLASSRRWWSRICCYRISRLDNWYTDWKERLAVSIVLCHVGKFWRCSVGGKTMVVMVAEWADGRRWCARVNITIWGMVGGWLGVDTMFMRRLYWRDSCWTSSASVCLQLEERCCLTMMLQDQYHPTLRHLLARTQLSLLQKYRHLNTKNALVAGSGGPRKIKDNISSPIYLEFRRLNVTKNSKSNGLTFNMDGSRDGRSSLRRQTSCLLEKQNRCYGMCRCLWVDHSYIK